jgi:folate-dependent phosphoribosylglycinamide formyltransferase PurN
MKILIAVSHDVFFKPRFLYNLILRLDEHEIVHVMEVRNVKRKRISEVSPAKFWGLKGVMVLAIIKLFRKSLSVFPFPAFIRSLSTVKRVSSLFEIPYSNVLDINNKEVVDYIREIKPDIVVSFQHQIFKKKLLSIPGVKFINCHPSLLPKYRGVKPIFWAMLNKDDKFGVTVHEMNIKIDCGGIISQREIKFYPEWSLFQNYIAAYEVSVMVVYEAIDKISKKNTILNTTSLSEKYYSMPSVNDLKIFKKNSRAI